MGEPLEPHQVKAIRDAALRMDGTISTHLADSSTVEDLHECFTEVVSATEEPYGATVDSLAETSALRLSELSAKGTIPRSREPAQAGEPQTPICHQLASGPESASGMMDLEKPIQAGKRQSELAERLEE
eukprot:4220333-Amphidinium_carterae.1